MNQYTITSIDPVLGAVYAHYEYNGHILDNTVFVDDVTNADLIQQTVKAGYDFFAADIDKIEKAVPDLPVNVTALVGQEQVQKDIQVQPEPVQIAPVDVQIQPQV
jgi:hypothetical protein